MTPCDVLVVDDERSIVHFVRRVLISQGCSVSSLSSGQEAIMVAPDLAPGTALLVVDVAMWPVTGIDVALRFQKFNPAIRVLFISGNTGREMLNEGDVNGLTWAFLSKPISPDALVASVDSLMLPPAHGSTAH